MPCHQTETVDGSSHSSNAGLDKDLKYKGVEWLNVFAVDNVLQQIADPVFVGATIESGCVSGSKVVRKCDPYERVGAMCLENGKPSIVEYYELTPEMAEAKNENGSLQYGFGVILNYLFRVDKLMAIAEKSLPLHVERRRYLTLMRMVQSTSLRLRMHTSSRHSSSIWYT